MRIATPTRCEDTPVRDDGRLDLIGVAPDRIGVPGLPWKGVFTVAVVLEPGPDDDRATPDLNAPMVRVADGETVREVEPGSANHSREVPSDLDVKLQG